MPRAAKHGPAEGHAACRTPRGKPPGAAPLGNTDLQLPPRDVQPVLNTKCIRCHTHDRGAAGVILTDDLSDQFTISYEELLPYLSLRGQSLAV